MIRAVRWLAGFLLAIGLAIVVGAIPVPAGGARAVAGGETVRVYVLSNGFHSDIAIPDAGGNAPNMLGIAASDFPVDPYRVHYWAIGWGSRIAYTSLLKVSDLTPGIIA